MTGQDQRTQLGSFLRARRDAVTPEMVGLQSNGRRRSPGLRREELATLAGISVTWLTWLEQGRPVHPSREVLDAIGRALHMTPAEHAHLLRLGGRNPGDFKSSPNPNSPSVRALLSVLSPSPAYAMDADWTIRAWNPPMAQLFADLPNLSGDHLNLLHIMFANANARRLIGDWNIEARRVLCQFRAECNLSTASESVVDLVQSLIARDDTFAAWWAEHAVDEIDSHVRVFHHPIAGELRFTSALLSESGISGVRFVVHLPIDGDDSITRLSSTFSPGSFTDSESGAGGTF